MIGLLCFVLAVLAPPFKSKLRLEAENAVLRHQLIVLTRRLHGRVRFTNNDRRFHIQLCRWFPSILQVLTIIRPETLVRWHRPVFVATGVGSHAHWEGGCRSTRELRALIRRMTVEIRFGARRAFTANCSSSGLRSRSRASPSTWSNGGGHPARDGEPSCITTRQTLPPWTCSSSQLPVSTCSMPLSSSDLSAESCSGSMSQQTQLRSGLRRDRDRIDGAIVTRRLRAMGIRDKPTAPASPWQNGFAERVIGTIWRECVDHIIVLGEMHLRRALKSYADYCNSVRTHRSLKQGCTGFSPGSANRCDPFTRHPGRTSSPLSPCLSFRYTQAVYTRFARRS